MSIPEQQKPIGPDVGFRMSAAALPPADDDEQMADMQQTPPSAPADSDSPGEHSDTDEHTIEPQIIAEQPDEAQAIEPDTVEPPNEASTTEQQMAELIDAIARELGAAAPEDWDWLEAYFSLTVAAEVAYVLYYDDDTGQVARTEPSAQVTQLARTHRELSAQSGDGPWWRLTVELENTGEVATAIDYGDEPFPDDQLLVPDAYLADLEAFPRERIPVWLAAYVFHDERQWRSPEQAASQARADRDADTYATRSYQDFPPLPALWARWATIAAAFIAAGSELGPRIRPALGIFEGAARSGSTLFILPGNRAVLSGGLWNAPELDAAYNDGDELPDLYAGAPDWVANQVLNPRAAQGMLSFCYWWSNGSWYRGESPTADQFSAAVPGMWSTQTTADIVCNIAFPNDPTELQRQAAEALVFAAEAGAVTRDILTAVFDNSADNIDGAMYQLSLAGLAATFSEPLPRDRAIIMVREYILGLGLDTTGYPLDQLVAERLDVGWMVFVPTEPGEIAIGRAIFYIADDGVIEQSSSSTPPSTYSAGFEQRFQQRQKAPVPIS